jgi:membrane protein implicated in regulation of membrane protease activity
MPGLLEWTSLIFTIPILFGALLVLGSALGFVDFGGDVDVDADVEADVDADVDADADIDADAPDADADHEVHGGPGVLELFGFGKVPLSVLLMVAAFLFGGLGLCTTLALAAVLPQTALRALVSLAVALVGAGVFTGAIARVLARWIPTTETYATTHWELLGTSGVAELDIDPRFGRANVRDLTGSLIKIRCRSYGARIPKGAEVLVTDYDPEAGVYTVEPSPV